MSRLARLAGVAIAIATMPAQGQDVRVTGVSWLQSIDLRPLRRDSVLLSATTGTGDFARGPDGQPVACIPGATWCTFLASGAREQTRPFLQDIGLAVWGLGRGVSVHAHARFRDALGSSPVAWPRLSDRFDLLDAFVEWDRDRVRARVGRQWSLGGLGAYNYDGGSLTLRRGWWDGDLFGGRALVQGLNEPYTSSELGVVDDLPPETSAWLIGGRVRARAGSSVAMTATYLRLLQNDRSGVYAERGAVDVSLRAIGVGLNASTSFDLASQTLNEARLRAARPLVGRLSGSLEVRRHRPFFELWTIWGAFAPVGFDEVRASAAWASPGSTLQLSASGARREYEDARTGLESPPLRTDGWRVSTDAAWSPDEGVTVSAAYGADIGFGSSQSDGSLAVAWNLRDRLEVGAALSALQSIYEFRVGTGRIVGGSGHAMFRLTDDVRFRADLGVYKHRLSNGAIGQDWSQRRASLRLEWAIGSDPGMER
jgi:hypothetical protein